MASVQALICSPAAAPTMVTPRINPLGSVTTLIWPRVSPLGLGAVVVVIGPAQHPDGAVPLPRLRSVRPDMGQLRLGERDARNFIGVACSTGRRNIRCLISSAAWWLGAVGELRQPDDVADRIDAAVAGAEALVDGDAVVAVPDPCGIEVETLDVRPPAGRDQQIGALDGLLGGAGEHDLDPLAQRPHPLDLDAAADRDAFARQRIEHDRDAFRVLLGERLRRKLQHRDLGAEPAERLRELEAARARAEHDQMLRPFACIEDILVGEIRALVDAGDRRHRRLRAGGDDKAARPDLELDVFLRPHSDRAAVEKTCLAFDDPHCRPAKRSLESFGASVSTTR